MSAQPTPPELAADDLAATNGAVPDEPDVAADSPRYTQLAAALVDVDGLRSIPAPDPLVDGWLYRDSLGWLGGKPGSAKTFAAVDLACCVATGTAWHGHDTTAGRVLYLIAEGAAGLSTRVDAWQLAHGQTVDNIVFLPVAAQLLVDVDLLALERLLGEQQPALVVLDTQARVSVGAEENSSRDMGELVHALERLRTASGACVLTVHHEPRVGENLRGSTALEGAATSIMRTSKDGQLVEVANPKQKDAVERTPLHLALTAVGESAVLSHEAVGLAGFTAQSDLTLLTEIWDAFGTRGASKTELREASQLPKSTYYRSLNTLVEKGLLTERREGPRTFYVPSASSRELQIPTSPTQSHEAGESSPTSHHPFRGGTGGTRDATGPDTGDGKEVPL